MLEYMLSHTHLTEFLTMSDLCRLRGVCADARCRLGHWARRCRTYDPDALWDVDRRPASCYVPPPMPEEGKWFVAYWRSRLPSVVPHAFWGRFFAAIRGFITLPALKAWCWCEQEPAYALDGGVRWRVSATLDIVGTSRHYDYHYPPDELKDIDEFVSLGVAWECPQRIQDAVLGLNPFSVGWHSDDGNIYQDSLVVSGAARFGRGDRVGVSLDYPTGTLLFEKNGRIVYVHELAGDFLCNPLSFGAVCKTKNSIFFNTIA